MQSIHLNLGQIKYTNIERGDPPKDVNALSDFLIPIIQPLFLVCRASILTFQGYDPVIRSSSVGHVIKLPERRKRGGIHCI
jgi:hypothetical protein